MQLSYILWRHSKDFLLQVYNSAQKLREAGLSFVPRPVYAYHLQLGPPTLFPRK